MNQKIISSVACFVFTAATTGTLAHAENAYQRARRGARLQERAATTEIKAARAIKSVLDRWNQVGSKVEGLVKNEAKLDRAIASKFDRAQKEIATMNPNQIVELKRQLRKVQKQTAQAGYVASAENLEATLDLPHANFRNEVIRTLAGTGHDRIKDRLLSEIENAGSVKAYLQKSVQKLTTRDIVSSSIYFAHSFIFFFVGAFTAAAGILWVVPVAAFVMAVSFLVATFAAE